MTRTFCVISQEVPSAMQEELRKSFDDVLLLPPDSDLAKPVRCHPDMIFVALDGRMFLSRRYYDENAAVINKITQLGGLEVSPTDVLRNKRYPNDVAFNIAVWHDAVICRPDVTCPALLSFAEKRGYHVVPVKQGYTGCSCLATDTAVLTFDRGIADILEHSGIPVLLLDGGGVSLPGYDCGFLGGATGFHDGTIYLYGSADTLPCSAELKSAGYPIVSLSQGIVTDYGGIKIFKKL